MAKVSDAERKTSLTVTQPNPFAFNPAEVLQKLSENQAEYLSPGKRKSMKDYLSSSSINLANGQEKRYESSDHFKSSNQALFADPGNSSLTQLKQIRAQINFNLRRRQDNVWMGRANEFKTYHRPEQATVHTTGLEPTMAHSGDKGAALRKPNFQFGFDNSQAESSKQLLKADAAEKSLYDYTKQTSENLTQWRERQIQKNRMSNI